MFLRRALFGFSPKDDKSHLSTWINAVMTLMTFTGQSHEVKKISDSIHAQRGERKRESFQMLPDKAELFP